MKAFLILVKEEYKANSVKNQLHHTNGIDEVIELSKEDLENLEGVVL